MLCCRMCSCAEFLNSEEGTGDGSGVDDQGGRRLMLTKLVCNGHVGEKGANRRGPRGVA
jgi:hypothetical protein